MSKSEDEHLELSKLQQSIDRLSASYSLPRAFIRGVVTGLGSVIGATAVFAILVYFMRNIEWIPIVGTWISDLAKIVTINMQQ